MVHPVESLEGTSLGCFALPDVRLQVIEGFGHDGEVTVLEEERDYALLHVGTLLCGLRLQILVDELWCVTHFDELRLHGSCLSSQLIALHDNLALRIHLFTDLLTLHDVLPPVKEVSLSVLSHMHQHSSEEFLFVIAFLSSHAHIMQGLSQAPLDQSIQDVANRPQSVLVVFAVARLETDCLLLPVLESLGLVEILHAVEDTRHELARVFLIMKALSDGIPQLLQPHLLILGDHLLVPPAQIQSDLSPLEPLLNRSFRLKESHVGFERFRLDAECLEDSKHLFQRIVVFTSLVSLDGPIGPDVLSLLNATQLIDLVLLTLLHHILRHDKLLKHLLLCIFAPSKPGFPQIAVLEAQEELVSRLDSPVIEVLLASRSPNPLEHLPSECLSCDGSDSIDGVLLAAYVRDPFEEYVLKFRHVNVASFSALERGKGRLEVLLDLVTVLRGRVQCLGQRLNLGSLLPASFVAGVDQVPPLIHLLLVLSVQFTLNRIVMLLGPGAEGSLKLVFHPVDEDFSHGALLLVGLARVFEPGVEAAAELHLGHAAHVVRHDFLREIL